MEIGLRYSGRLQWNGFIDLYSRANWVFLGGGSGNPLVDLVRGRPDFAIAGHGTTDLALRTASWQFYVQDDIHFSSRLTFNLGLRYEYNSPPSDIRHTSECSGPYTQQCDLCTRTPACQFFP